jgi:hypothetical protein
VKTCRSKTLFSERRPLSRGRRCTLNAEAQRKIRDLSNRRRRFLEDAIGTNFPQSPLSSPRLCVSAVKVQLATQIPEPQVTLEPSNTLTP